MVRLNTAMLFKASHTNNFISEYLISYKNTKTDITKYNKKITNVTGSHFVSQTFFFSVN